MLLIDWHKEFPYKPVTYVRAQLIKDAKMKKIHAKKFRRVVSQQRDSRDQTCALSSTKSKPESTPTAKTSPVREEKSSSENQISSATPETEIAGTDKQSGRQIDGNEIANKVVTGWREDAAYEQEILHAVKSADCTTISNRKQLPGTAAGLDTVLAERQVSVFTIDRRHMTHAAKVMSRPAFVREFGESSVMQWLPGPGLSTSLSNLDDNGLQGLTEDPVRRVELGALLEAWDEERLLDRWVFEKSTFHEKTNLEPELGNPGLLRELSQKTFMPPFVQRPSWTKSRPYELLSLGSSGSGITFHQHPASWLMLYAGIKVWFLYPPGKFCRGSSHCISTEAYNMMANASPLAVLRKLSSLSKQDRPHVLIQRPGELVLLPHFWWHATINVHECLGVGGQIDVPSQADLELHTTGPTEYRSPVALELAATQVYQTPTMRQYTKTKKLLKESFKLAPRSVTGAATLADFIARRGQLTESVITEALGVVRRLAKEMFSSADEGVLVPSVAARLILRVLTSPLFAWYSEGLDGSLIRYQVKRILSITRKLDPRLLPHQDLMQWIGV